MRVEKDFLLERYSVISESRSKRPHHFEKSAEKSDGVCFFCPGNEKLTPPTLDRYPETGDWKIRVFRNKFPALCPPLGDHEIIVETEKHGKGIEDLSADELVKVFEMYEKRRKLLEAKYKHVSIFKNVGRDAGASLPHSHTQILATDFVPRIVAAELKAARAYKQKNKSCPWCNLTLSINEKLIAHESNDSIAFAAQAPRFSYELWLMPKRHVANFSELTKEEALDFCSIIKKVLTKAKEFGSYNIAFHHGFHFHLELLPRVAKHAGFELGDGAYIIDVAPEDAAKFY
jgi:UDPglucose--hexose-1-phosphate uridylyltransferase